ncbi:hypothetical protein TRFO_19806 [Tritrichomonas foetus]|uniref:Uncharacterized protein n=1 Tax=Tritrichomonas foetus TaxID=1144522 RepID=A0A1J4KIR5_9EUKA|nr:hypothetical protein TRFO_19806 [Tritrichomonas foetus]|eukprot:OHT10824.1 hypothetical protein TRFO_19806 [Tritrichomonas foetus]
MSEFLTEVGEFQDKLIDLVDGIQFSYEESSSQTFDEIINLCDNFVKNKNTLFLLLLSINGVSRIFPRHSEIFEELIFHFIDDIKNFFTSDQLSHIFCSNNKFLYILMKEGAINVKSLLHFKFCFSQFCLFYKEFKSECNNYYIKIYQEKEDIRKAIKSIDKTKHDEYRILGQNPHPIAVAIRNDDYDSFYEILSKCNMEIDSNIPYSFYESSYILNNRSIMPTLIEYAAYFGSKIIFRSLWEQYNIVASETKNLPLSLPIYAISGGNLEIIHDIETKFGKFNDDYINFAVFFYRNQLADYLVDQLTYVDPVQIAISSIYLFNINSFLNYFGKINPNNVNKMDNGTAILHVAVVFGCLEVVKMILSIPDVNVNLMTGNDPMTPLHLALLHHKDDIALYLGSLDSVNKNIKDYQKRTPNGIAASTGNLEYLKQHIDESPTIKEREDLFRVAASKNRVNIMEFLLNQEKTISDESNDNENDTKIDINSKDKKSNTALFLAAKNGHYEAVCFLLSLQGIDINCQCESLTTPFFTASRWGFLNIVQKLAACEGIDVNLRPNDGATAFLRAIRKSHINVVQFLLTIPEVDREIIDNSGWMPIQKAVYYKNDEMIKLIHSTCKNDINHKNNEGYTAFILAASCPSVKTVQYLLTVDGIDVNSQTITGVTALHNAVANRKFDVINVLLNDKRINPNLQDNDGQTALHFAIQEQDLDIISCLLKSSRIDPNIKNNGNVAPICMAAKIRNIEIIKLLCQHPRIDINSQYNNNLTALSLAITMNNTDVALYLLENESIDINCHSKDGYTPLMLAIKNNNFELCKKISKHPKIDLNFYIDHGTTAISLAVIKKNIDIIKLLIKRNANLNIQCMDRFAPFQIAVKSRNKEIIELLLDTNKIDVNIVDSKGKIVLFYVLDDVAFLDYLINKIKENGMNVNYHQLTQKREDIFMYMYKKAKYSATTKYLNELEMEISHI